MKKIILLIIIITTFINCKKKEEGQRVDFKVTYYEVKGENYDYKPIKKNIKLSFYRSNDTLYFTSQWEKSNSKSYGVVSEITKRNIRKAFQEPRKEEYKFLWSFRNLFDKKKGEALVTFTETFYDDIVKFSAEIDVYSSPLNIVLKGNFDVDNNTTNNLNLGYLYELSKSKFTAITEKYNPEFIEDEEFYLFKKKSNYIETIEAYDKNNFKKYDGLNTKYISFYPVPTEINTQSYLNNSILFGDLNGDDKRDCIISVFRADNYNEITFFYVFINYGDSFKLEDVVTEEDICGCKMTGWPSLFRYQKIEDGYLKGISMCHYKDAHCCASIYFETVVEFKNGKLQFNSAEFIMDDATEYRQTPPLDSVLVKTKI